MSILPQKPVYLIVLKWVEFHYPNFIYSAQTALLNIEPSYLPMSCSRRLDEPLQLHMQVNKGGARTQILLRSPMLTSTHEAEGGAGKGKERKTENKTRFPKMGSHS